MNQIKSLSKISEYLSWFKVQIELLNANGQFDINIISEDILRPILNEIYQISLESVKKNSTLNYPGIDLIDCEKRVGFQISSENKFRKIKHTIEVIKSHKLYETVDQFFICFLAQDVVDYKQDVVEELTNNLFNLPQHNVIAFNDLYKKVSLLNYEIIRNVEQILERQFFDNLNSKTNQSSLTIIQRHKLDPENRHLTEELDHYILIRNKWLKKRFYLEEQEVLIYEPSQKFSLIESLKEVSEKVAYYNDCISSKLTELNKRNENNKP